MRAFFSDKYKFWNRSTSTEKHEGDIANSNYTTLASTILTGDSLKSNEVYLSSLKEAIKMPENQNIALMGNYGSGKSSILKTFEKYNPDNNYLFLSLASFFNKEDTNKFGVTVRSKLEKIENILVKQMIYKKRIKDLPYSRFKRISNISEKSILFHAFLVLVFISLLINTYTTTQVAELTISVETIPQILIIGLSFYFISKILVLFSKVYKYSKFSFKSFTIEPLNDKTSSFSKYLDEIIYFFEVSRTNIVVIEDIDRFNSIEIFEHLRELNYLLNNSEQIEQPVKFIYAVRNDLFNNDDESKLKESEEFLRTKFFDFILPIIPVVDYKNSRDFLTPKVNEILNSNFDGKLVEFNNDIERFLWGISIYIDDLRLIYNICNEFEVYIKKLPHINSNEKIKKLFALIVFKNIYPEDFSGLQRKKGNLYDVFHSDKDSIVKNRKSDIEKNIKRNRDILEGSNYEVSKSAKTAILYLFVNKDDTSNLNNLTYSVNTNDRFTNQRIIPLTNKVINDFLKVKESMRIQSNRGNYSILKEEIVENFKRFRVDTDEIIEELELEEREERNNKVQELSSEIRFLNTLTIKDLTEEVADDELNIKKKFDKYELLMKHLLSEGHIDEQYIYYISIFYENELNENDLSIVQKLKSNTMLNDNEQIFNYEVALYELSKNDYRKPSILNKNILLYIFNNNKYKDEQYSIIDVFLNKIDRFKKMELLKELFTESVDRTEEFLFMALQKMNNMYEIVSLSAENDSGFKEELAYRIFASCGRELLQLSIDNDTVLKSEVESIPGFALNLLESTKVNSETSKEIFVTNDFKFRDAALIKMSNDDFMFFTKQRLYIVNPKNIFDIYRRLTNKTTDTFSIEGLLNIDTKELTEHINDSFDEFVMLLNENEKTYEGSKILLRILNDSTVSNDLKASVIRKNVFPIDIIEEVKDPELRLEIFKVKKFTVGIYNLMKASSEEIKYVLQYFTDPEKINKFIEETKKGIISEDFFESVVSEFMNKLVNNHNLEVDKDNIDFFKINQNYSVEGMNDTTFYHLLNENSIKPTLGNLKELSGKKKMLLMSHDEQSVSEFYNQLSIDEDEIILGLSIFKEDLLSKIVGTSYENGNLTVENKVRWLTEVLKNKVNLAPKEINVLFMYENLKQSDVLLEYLEYVISKNVLSDNEILENMKNIDATLKQVQKGSRGTKRVNIKYYNLLMLLKERGIISSITPEKDTVKFNNKLK